MKPEGNPVEVLKYLRENRDVCIEQIRDANQENRRILADEIKEWDEEIAKICPPVPKKYKDGIPQKNAEWGEYFDPARCPFSHYIKAPHYKNKTSCIIILGASRETYYSPVRAVEIWIVGIFTIMKLATRQRVDALRKATKIFFAIPSTKTPLSTLIGVLATQQDVEPEAVYLRETKLAKSQLKAKIDSKKTGIKGAKIHESAEEESASEEEIDETPPFARVVNIVMDGNSVAQAFDTFRAKKDWDSIKYMLDNKDKVEWVVENYAKDNKFRPTKKVKDN